MVNIQNFCYFKKDYFGEDKSLKMNKYPLILLHGALGAKRQLESLKAELSTNFDVHSLTFAGHGGVPNDAPLSMELFAQNVVDFMDENSIEKAHFFGYSMGGYVALTLASTHPERVLKIVTLGTKFAWTPDFSALEVKKLNPEKIIEKVPKFAAYQDSLHTPLDWKQVMHNTADMMLELGNGSGLSETQIHQISTSTLITIGDLDNMSTVEESQLIAEQLPHGSFKIMEGFEHPIEKINTAEMSETIHTYLLND